MREIKFRAWDGKHMYWPDYIDNESGVAMNYTGGSELNDSFQTENHQLMQYTGLKDKNGKEIYEGDIVEHDDYYFEGIDNGATGYSEWRRVRKVVVFDDEYASFIFEDEAQPIPYYPSAEHDHEYEFEDDYEKGLKVIGNIYENPELLT